MKELSFHILDIAENAANARAKRIQILIEETDDTLTITVSDDGFGMMPAFLVTVENPFVTTRTTRRVGLGIPLFKMAAEQTGGRFAITSRHRSTNPVDHGTDVVAVFYKAHIDFTPLGDIVSTMKTLIFGHPDIDFLLVHRTPFRKVLLNTRQIRGILGTDIPLNTFEVIRWIEQYLREQYGNS